MKHKIDLGPPGPAGVEAEWWDDNGVRYVWIAPTDHWRDWLHHVTPGARRREVNAATKIRRAVMALDATYYVGGHSWGGCIAVMVTAMLGETAVAYVYGGERAPVYWADKAQVYSWQQRGDWVPYLPPWRASYHADWPTHCVFGSWLPPWKAHLPDNYYRHMKAVGFR